MGELFSTPVDLMPEFRQFEDWSLSDVQALFERFQQMQMRRGFGFAVNMSTFLSVMDSQLAPKRKKRIRRVPVDIFKARLLEVACRHKSGSVFRTRVGWGQTDDGDDEVYQSFLRKYRNSLVVTRTSKESRFAMNKAADLASQEEKRSLRNSVKRPVRAGKAKAARNDNKPNNPNNSPPASLIRLRGQLGQGPQGQGKPGAGGKLRSARKKSIASDAKPRRGRHNRKAAESKASPPRSRRSKQVKRKPIDSTMSVLSRIQKSVMVRREADKSHMYLPSMSSFRQHLIDLGLPTSQLGAAGSTTDSPRQDSKQQEVPRSADADADVNADADVDAGSSGGGGDGGDGGGIGTESNRDGEEKSNVRATGGFSPEQRAHTMVSTLESKEKTPQEMLLEMEAEVARNNANKTPAQIQYGVATSAVFKSDFYLGGKEDKAGERKQTHFISKRDPILQAIFDYNITVRSPRAEKHSHIRAQTLWMLWNGAHLLDSSSDYPAVTLLTNSQEKHTESSEDSRNGVGTRSSSTHTQPQDLESYRHRQVDFLMMLAAQTVVCHGTHSAKMDFLFSLFDFEENGILTINQMVRLCSYVARGLAVMCGLPPLPDKRVAQLLVEQLKSSKAIRELRSATFSSDRFYVWTVVDKYAVSVLTRWGTTDGGMVVRLFDEHRFYEGLAARQRQRTHKVSVSQKPDRFQFHPERCMRDVLKLKMLFDSRDYEEKGHLDLDFLRRPKQATDAPLLRDITAIFQSIPRDAFVSDIISFPRLLEVLYKDTTPDERALMLSWVPDPVTRKTIKRVKRVFDRLDTSFSGHVPFGSMIEAMESGHYGQDFVKLVKLYRTTSLGQEERFKDRPVRMRDFVSAVFSKICPRQMKRILAWAKPSKLLNETQQSELAMLFRLYDSDRDGTVDASELRTRLEGYGLPDREIERMFDAIDVNEDGSVTLKEFQLFYREIWGEYINFTIDTPMGQKEESEWVHPSNM